MSHTALLVALPQHDPDRTVDAMRQHVAESTVPLQSSVQLTPSRTAG